MAKRNKRSGFGAISAETFTTERKRVIDVEPDGGGAAEIVPVTAPRTSGGTKPTWKQEGVEYTRMSFYVSKDLKQKIKIAVATEEGYPYQDALVNAALESFFEAR